MSDAVSYHRYLADRLLERSTMTAFSSIAKSERADFEALRSRYRAEIDSSVDYQAVMALGEKVIAEAEAWVMDPDGHLGVLRVLREEFAFLRCNGFEMVWEEICDADYVAPWLTVRLRLPPGRLMDPSYLVKLSAGGAECFLDDLLYRADPARFAMPREIPSPTTASEVRALFRGAATILERHGTDVLSGQAGAFEALQAAARERGARVDAECERLYGPLPPAIDG